MRARSAVSLPSASQPTVRSMRIGWRLAWIRNDSSRENVHLTGASSRNAASAVCAWFAMSSLPPKAPPFDTSSTVIRSASIPSTDAIWSRSSHTPWPPEYIVKAPASVRIRHDEGRLGLEERLLDALGLEHLVHDVRARGERGVDVAALVGGARQHVAVELPHGVVGVGERGDGVGDRCAARRTRSRRARRPGARWRGRPPRRTRARRRGTTCGRPRG